MGAPASHWLVYFYFVSEAAKQICQNLTICPLPSLCFWTDRDNKMAALTYDWLRHFGLFFWICLMEFDETRQKASTQCPLPIFCFCADRKTDNCPGQFMKKGVTLYSVARYVALWTPCFNFLSVLGKGGGVVCFLIKSPVYARRKSTFYRYVCVYVASCMHMRRCHLLSTC